MSWDLLYRLKRLRVHERIGDNEQQQLIQFFISLCCTLSKIINSPTWSTIIRRKSRAKYFFVIFTEANSASLTYLWSNLVINAFCNWVRLITLHCNWRATFFGILLKMRLILLKNSWTAPTLSNFVFGWSGKEADIILQICKTNNHKNRIDHWLNTHKSLLLRGHWLSLPIISPQTKCSPNFDTLSCLKSVVAFTIML